MAYGTRGTTCRENVSQGGAAPSKMAYSAARQRPFVPIVRAILSPKSKKEDRIRVDGGEKSPDVLSDSTSPEICFFRGTLATEEDAPS